MNQDTEWYGDCSNDKSASIDHIDELPREEQLFQRRISSETRSQSVQSVRSSSQGTRYRSSSYDRDRYEDQWSNSNWRPLDSSSSRPTYPARIDEAYPSRRRNAHSSDSSSGREENQPPYQPTFQRGYFTSKMTERSRPRSRPSRFEPLDSSTTNSRDEDAFSRRYSSKDVMPYKPSQPPPSLSGAGLPLYRPDQPPPGFIPCGNIHEKKIFDALPSPPPPPRFEYNITERGDIVVQPPRPAAITPAQQDEPIEIPDSPPPPPITEKLEWHKPTSSQVDRKVKSMKLDPHSQPGPSKVPETQTAQSNGSFITKTKLKRGTLIDLTDDDNDTETAPRPPETNQETRFQKWQAPFGSCGMPTMPPVPPLPMYDNRGQQYPTVPPQLEYMKMAGVLMVPPTYPLPVPIFYGPSPDYQYQQNKKRRNQNNEQGADAAPEPSSTHLQASIPTPPPQTTVTEEEPDLEDVADARDELFDEEFNNLELPYNKDPWASFMALVERARSRMIKTLTYCHTREEFIKGLRFLTELVSRNMERIPTPANKSAFSGKIYLISYMTEVILAVSNMFPRMGFAGVDLITYLNTMVELLVVYLRLVVLFFNDETQRQKTMDATRLGRIAAYLMSKCLLNRMDYIVLCIVKARPEFGMYLTDRFWNFIFWHFVVRVRYSRERPEDLYKLYVLYRMYQETVNRTAYRLQTAALFTQRYGDEQHLRQSNELIRRVAENQDANDRYVSRHLADDYLEWWSPQAVCPGVPALIGACGVTVPEISQDAWFPDSSALSVQDEDEMSMTFWERFYTREFYFGIQETQWEIFTYQEGINLMNARYRTVGDRELAGIFTSDSSCQSDQPGPSRPLASSQSLLELMQAASVSSGSEVVNLSDADDDILIIEPDEEVQRPTVDSGTLTTENEKDCSRALKIESELRHEQSEQKPVVQTVTPVAEVGLEHTPEWASESEPDRTKATQTKPNVIEVPEPIQVKMESEDVQIISLDLSTPEEASATAELPRETSISVMVQTELEPTEPPCNAESAVTKEPEVVTCEKSSVDEPNHQEKTVEKPNELEETVEKSIQQEKVVEQEKPSEIQETSESLAVPGDVAAPPSAESTEDLQIAMDTSQTPQATPELEAENPVPEPVKVEDKTSEASLQEGSSADSTITQGCPDIASLTLSSSNESQAVVVEKQLPESSSSNESKPEPIEDRKQTLGDSSSKEYKPELIVEETERSSSNESKPEPIEEEKQASETTNEFIVKETETSSSNESKLEPIQEEKQASERSSSNESKPEPIEEEKQTPGDSSLNESKSEPIEDERQLPAKEPCDNKDMESTQNSDEIAHAFVTKLVEFLQLKLTEIKALALPRQTEEPDSMLTSFQALLSSYSSNLIMTKPPIDLINHIIEPVLGRQLEKLPHGDFPGLTHFFPDLLDETRPEYHTALAKLSRLLPAFNTPSEQEEKPKTPRIRVKLVVSPSPTGAMAPRRRGRPRTKLKSTTAVPTLTEDPIIKRKPSIATGQRRGRPPSKPAIPPEAVTTEPTVSTTSRKRHSERRTGKRKKGVKSREGKRKKSEGEDVSCVTEVLQPSDGQSPSNKDVKLFDDVTAASTEEPDVKPEVVESKVDEDGLESKNDVDLKSLGVDDAVVSPLKSLENIQNSLEEDRLETSDSSLSVSLPYEKLDKKKVQQYFNRKRRQYELTGTCSSDAGNLVSLKPTVCQPPVLTNHDTDSSVLSSLSTTSLLTSSASSLSSDSYERSLNVRDPRLSGQSEVAKRYRQTCEAQPTVEWRDVTVIYNENSNQLETPKQPDVVASPKPTATSCLDFYNSFGREVSVDVQEETELPQTDLIDLASPNTEGDTITINLRHILNNLKQEPLEDQATQVIPHGTVFLTPEWDFDQQNQPGYGNFNMPITGPSTSQTASSKNPHLIENLIGITPEEVPAMPQQPAVVFGPASDVVETSSAAIQPEAAPAKRSHSVSFFEQRAGEIYAQEFGQRDNAAASRASTRKYSWRDAAVTSLAPYHRPKTPAPSKSKKLHVTAEDNELFQNAFEGPVVKPNRGFENEFSKLLWTASGSEQLNGQASTAMTVKPPAAPIPDPAVKENLVSILKKSKSKGDNKRRRIQFENPNTVESSLVDPNLNKLVGADCDHTVVQQPTDLLLDYTFNNLAAAPISNTNSQLYPAAVSNNLLNYYPVDNVTVQPQVEEVPQEAGQATGGNAEEDLKEPFEEDYANTYTDYACGGFIGDSLKGQPPESAVMIKDNPFIGGQLEESRSPVISTGATSPMLEGSYLNSVNLYEASRKETELFGALPENVALSLEKTLAQLPPKKRKLTEDQELAIYIQKFKEEKEQRTAQVVEEQISYPAQRQMSIAELHRDYPKIKTVAARKFYPTEPPNNTYFDYQQPFDQYNYDNKRSVMNVYINGVRECSANYPLCLMIGTMHTCVNNGGQEAAAQLPPEQLQLPQQAPLMPPVPEPPVMTGRKRGRKPNPPQQGGEPIAKRGRGRPRKNPIT